MPYQTDRQLAASALHQAFLVNLIAEAEAQLLQDGEESDYSSTSDSSSSDEETLTASDTLLDVMGQLYSKHYFTAHEAIPKDSNQLYLFFIFIFIYFNQVYCARGTIPMLHITTTGQ